MTTSYRKFSDTPVVHRRRLMAFRVWKMGKNFVVRSVQQTTLKVVWDIYNRIASIRDNFSRRCVDNGGCPVKDKVPVQTSGRSTQPRTNVHFRSDDFGFVFVSPLRVYSSLSLSPRTTTMWWLDPMLPFQARNVSHAIRSFDFESEPSKIIRLWAARARLISRRQRSYTVRYNIVII